MDNGDPDQDDDYEVSADEEDDEQTILEQETMEVDVDHKNEIAELEAESEFSLFSSLRNIAIFHE